MMTVGHLLIAAIATALVSGLIRRLVPDLSWEAMWVIWTLTMYGAYLWCVIDSRK